MGQYWSDTLKSQTTGMLITCVTINSNINKKPNIILEVTSERQFDFADNQELSCKPISILEF